MADAYRELTIQFRGDTTDLSRRLPSLRRGSSEVEHEAATIPKRLPDTISSRRSKRLRRRSINPRMRGEHMRPDTMSVPVWGSSPHARGAPSAETRAASRQRIIPACAGSTGRRDGLKCLTKDHPRMRGEHSTSIAGSKESPGSSPHARGAPIVEAYAPYGIGIIPACAGSTTTRPSRTS